MDSPALLPRRAWLKQSAAAGGGLALAQFLAGSAAAAPPPGPSSSASHASLKITDVRTFALTPDRHRLLVVKVQTSEPGLYGLGCATFTQRLRVVDTAVTQYLKPFLVGKNPLAIEDLWQSMFVSSYWRNSGVLNNAIAGIDMACWDILGKQAGLPVWQLLGGKARRSAEIYRHVSGSSREQLETECRKLMDQGQRHLRIQFGAPGSNAYGYVAGMPDPNDRDNAKERRWDSAGYCRELPRLFAHLREKLGQEVELLHDVHERVTVPQAAELCKALEPYRLFFLEDPLSPENLGHFRQLRSQTSIPLAMGELFTNPAEFVPLVSERLIDFIRIHVSQIGGLTPARKVAALCDFFGVRTAWHGPPDMTPIAHACNLHLNLATPNFGIQEGRAFNQAERDIFPGCPEIKDGSYWANDRPGWGLDFDERVAAKFPIVDDPPFDMSWGNVRRPDGSVQKP